MAKRGLENASPRAAVLHRLISVGKRELKSCSGLVNSNLTTPLLRYRRRKPARGSRRVVFCTTTVAPSFTVGGQKGNMRHSAQHERRKCGRRSSIDVKHSSTFGPSEHSFSLGNQISVWSQG